jgi:hypothetical protein
MLVLIDVDGFSRDNHADNNGIEEVVTAPPYKYSTAKPIVKKYDEGQ